ncbi:MAG: hypothetical protein Q8R44_18880 [Novosphingobium sp.]|nr:hypothetical protein [Novosphingobium sp.]
MSAPIGDTLHASPDSVGKLRLEGKLVRSHRSDLSLSDKFSGMMAFYP